MSLITKKHVHGCALRNEFRKINQKETIFELATSTRLRPTPKQERRRWVNTSKLNCVMKFMEPRLATLSFYHLSFVNSEAMVKEAVP